MTRKIRIKKEEEQKPSLGVVVGIDLAKEGSEATTVNISTGVVNDTPLSGHISSFGGVTLDRRGYIADSNSGASIALDTGAIREMISSELSRRAAADTDRMLLSSMMGQTELRASNPNFPSLVSFEVLIDRDVRRRDLRIAIRARFDRRTPQVYEFRVPDVLLGRTGNVADFINTEIRPVIREALSQIVLNAYEEEVLSMAAREFTSLSRL